MFLQDITFSRMDGIDYVSYMGWGDPLRLNCEMIVSLSEAGDNQ